MRKTLTLLIFILVSTILSAQKKTVAITMDDLFFAFNDIGIEKIEKDSDSLLNSISNLKVPVTVFVNEKSFSENGETEKRIAIYKEWINNNLITIGNHTFSHKNYAETDLALFEEDIIKGESITKELLKGTNKKLKYFRFPFNCTGKDSVSRDAIYSFLEESGYVNIPFTIESADYMYNALYCNYLRKGDKKEADKIADEYINFTVDLFKYFENVSNDLYGRNIAQIYLCHTNELNAACFTRLVTRLKEAGYSFVSLDEALKDKMYSSKDYYTEKYGVSWIYRWIEKRKDRIARMKKEPYSEEIETLYNNMNKQ